MAEYEFYIDIFPQGTDFDNYLWIRVPLWESKSSPEKFQHTTGTNKSKKRLNEEGKKSSFTLPVSSTSLLYPP